jgi:hypothetical protein
VKIPTFFRAVLLYSISPAGGSGEQDGDRFGHWISTAVRNEIVFAAKKPSSEKDNPFRIRLSGVG